MVRQACFLLHTPGDSRGHELVRIRRGTLRHSYISGDTLSAMNNTTRRAVGVSCGTPLPESKWKEAFLACIWIVPAIGAVVGILLLVTERVTFSQAGRKFLSSLVYSALIGIPSTILLNWIGFRYT